MTIAHLQIDSKKMDQSSTYLKLPATVRDLEGQGQPGLSPSKGQIHAGGLTLNVNDSFEISTLVCSTKLTHNGKLCVSSPIIVGVVGEICLSSSILTGVAN